MLRLMRGFLLLIGLSLAAQGAWAMADGDCPHHRTAQTAAAQNEASPGTSQAQMMTLFAAEQGCSTCGLCCLVAAPPPLAMPWAVGGSEPEALSAAPVPHAPPPPSLLERPPRVA